MKNYIDRYSEFFSEQNEKFTIMNGIIYRLYNGMIVPFAPASEDVHLNEEQARKLLSRLGGRLVRWTSGEFDFSGEKAWYALICRNFHDIGEYSSKLRNEIKKGLSGCSVTQVDADYICEHGHDVYLSAIGSYRKYKGDIMDRKSFINHFSPSRGYDDIIHYWGVFHNSSLIGYSCNFVFEKTESLYSSIKLEPKYLNLYPTHALIYTMNRFYLEANQFEYVNDGFRTLLHATEFQNFLMKKFNFIKAGLDLRIHYNAFYEILVKALYPYNSILGRIDDRIKALFALEQIRRS